MILQAENAARLAGAIPFGRENAVTRRELAMRLGVSDREMRKMIEDGRAEGLIIINDCTGRGYYQTDDLAEMERQYRQDTSRAMAILKRRVPLRNALKKAGRNV